MPQRPRPSKYFAKAAVRKVFQDLELNVKYPGLEIADFENLIDHAPPLLSQTDKRPLFEDEKCHQGRWRKGSLSYRRQSESWSKKVRRLSRVQVCDSVRNTFYSASDCHGLCDPHGSRVGYSPGRVRVAFM